MKPPSRKHYQKTEIERLKDQIAKLEKERPEALGIQSTIESLRMQAKRLVAENDEAKAVIHDLRIVADWFDILKRSEVMVATKEGMKYLVGQDLDDFCRAEIDKQNLTKVWWGDPVLPSAFAQHAKDHLASILRDEIDKCVVVDSKKYITFKTKGRYDSRSKSKKESR